MREKMDNQKFLFEACLVRDIKIVKFLVEEGVDIEAKDNRGYTPLHFASYHGCTEIIKFLVEEGADIEAKNNNGKTFYFYLSKENKKEIDFFLKDIEERKRMIKPCKK